MILREKQKNPSRKMKHSIAIDSVPAIGIEIKVCIN